MADELGKSYQPPVTVARASQDSPYQETESMSMTHAPNTEELLARVARGDDEARGQLLHRHRARLRRMIALRLDPRLRRRVDPSDVLQESLAEADRKLSDYAGRRPLPFYPWLRQLAWECLVRLHRRHVQAGRRSVRREDPAGPGLSDSSALALAERLAARSSTASAPLRRQELRERLHKALGQLAEADREVLVLRFLEDLSTRELAAVLGVGESAVKMRQLRALQRLRDLLGDDLAEELR
jgi:RNA polymerase sigma-70 factor (ECF subfamily)